MGERAGLGSGGDGPAGDHAAPEPGRPHALLLVSLVNLAALEALLGEDCAAELLRAAARRLAAAAPRAGGLWQAGARRFAVGVPGLGAEGAERLAAALAAALAETPVPTRRGPLGLRIAIGCAAAPDGDAARLGDAAQAALAAAEAAGGGIRVLAADAASAAARQAGRSAAAEAAMACTAEGALRIGFRPVLRAGARIASFHIAHPRIGSRARDEIAPDAAALGLLPQIDRAVLAGVLATLETAPRARIAIPVAVESLEDPGWSAALAASGKARDHPAERLILAVSGPGEALLRLGPALARLRSLGPALALDAGRPGGPDPLALHALRPDILTLPGPLLGRAAGDPALHHAIAQTVGLAERLETMTVALGLGSAAEARAAQRLGIDYLEGYRPGAEGIGLSSAPAPLLARIL